MMVVGDNTNNGGMLLPVGETPTRVKSETNRIAIAFSASNKNQILLSIQE